MKTLFVILLALVLAGCGSTPKDDKPPVALADSKKTVEIDRRLLVACEDLDKLDVPTDGNVLNLISAWSEKYKSCKDGKASLIKVVKDAFNIQ